MNIKNIIHKILHFKVGYFKVLTILLINSLEPILSDSLYLKLLFYLRVRYWPDLKNPRSFNEKLQWLKLNDIHPEYGKLVDKITVKDYVVKKIGEEYLIPTIGVYNTIEDIDWNKLPSQFVLKSTCDSGGVIICKDKNSLDIKSAVRKLRKSAKRDYSRYNKEYPYKYVTHRYIAETYLSDESGLELKDYKFFCFNGEPKFVQLDFDRFVNHRRNVYDSKWNLIDLQILFPKGHDRVFPKPINFEDMLEIASKLSEGIPHVRIDLYNIKGKIYFGEMTFFHGSGMEPFTPREWDYVFGEHIILPSINK